MRYQHFTITLLIALSCLSGCNSRSIGSFEDRITAENAALEYLVDNYKWLPTTASKKIYYSYRKDEKERKNCIWYEKGTSRLALEADPGSGVCCSWLGIDQVKLSQLVKEKKGLFQADFLGKPEAVGYRGDF